MSWNRDTDANRSVHNLHLPGGSERAKARALELSGAKSSDSDEHHLIITTLRGVAVGAVNTHHCDRLNRSFEYGIFISREHWSHGYATDAIKVLLRHFFAELGYHKVNAWVYAFNERSAKLHERLGMQLEGTARETHFANGEFHDAHLYGMTASEFFDRYGRIATS